MIRYLVVLMLAGCSGVSKHETLSLQCLGFCAMTNVNHEANKEPEKAQPVVPSTPLSKQE